MKPERRSRKNYDEALVMTIDLIFLSTSSRLEFNAWDCLSVSSFDSLKGIVEVMSTERPFKP